LIKSVRADGIWNVLDEDIEIAVVVVVDEEGTLAVLAVIREPGGLAYVFPGTIPVTFEEQVARGRVLSSLVGRFGNKDIEIAIAVVVSDRNALPGARVRRLLDDSRGRLNVGKGAI